MNETFVLILVGAAALALTHSAAVRWKGQRYLCDDCKFNDPELCRRAERPKALTCTAYIAKDS